MHILGCSFCYAVLGEVAGDQAVVAFSPRRNACGSCYASNACGKGESTETGPKGIVYIGKLRRLLIVRGDP